MPGRISGVDLANVVAERYPEAGILVASGRMRPDELDLPRSAEFLAKPYDFATVIARLKAMSTTP
jgi:two-component system cell cycle response regulator CpdR